MGDMFGGGGGGGGGGMLGGLANMGVGTATMFGAFDPKEPNYRSLANETANYYQQMPAIFAAQSQWSPQFTNLYGQQQQQALMGPNGAVSRYSQALPAVSNAYQSAFPEYSKNLSNLMNVASNDVALGSQLDPNEQRKLLQNYYSQSPMHGLGGSYDSMGAAINSYLGGQQLRQQRLQNASNIYGQYGASIAAPASAALGNLFGQANQANTYAQGQIGSPFNQYAQDAYDTNMGARWDYQKYIAQLHQAGANQTAQGGASFTGGAMML